MTDVGVRHGLVCVVIANWVWDKLVVMSQALRIPSINHVMGHGLQYQVAGWTLLLCTKNCVKNLLPAVC